MVEVLTFPATLYGEAAGSTARRRERETNEA
jgi:hypothetical protein